MTPAYHGAVGEDGFALGLVEVTLLGGFRFAARDFEDVQITRVIDVIAEGAISINHAISMAENWCGHSGYCSDGQGTPPFQRYCHG